MPHLRKEVRLLYLYIRFIVTLYKNYCAVSVDRKLPPGFAENLEQHVAQFFYV